MKAKIWLDFQKTERPRRLRRPQTSARHFAGELARNFQQSHRPERNHRLGRALPERPRTPNSAEPFRRARGHERRTAPARFRGAQRQRPRANHPARRNDGGARTEVSLRESRHLSRGRKRPALPLYFSALQRAVVEEITQYLQARLAASSSSPRRPKSREPVAARLARDAPRVGPRWLPPDRYQQLRAARPREGTHAFSTPRAIRTSWNCKPAGSPAISDGTSGSVCGKAIEIVQFGVWNREAGPDFQDAAIRLDGR